MTRLADRARTVHVEQCMGTVFSIDIRDPGEWTAAIGEAVVWLHRVDSLFSTYKADSDISRIRRGHLTVRDADPDIAHVLDLCSLVEVETLGHFSASWDTALDPTGLVKGWAIEQAGRILTAQGTCNHAVNGGGDIRLTGESAPGQPWRVGISDPFDRARVLTVVTGRDFAVATSGIAERGPHIVNPVTGVPARALASATIVGPCLTRVDAYATAAFAMGPKALRWIEGIPGHEALLVSSRGVVTSSAAFPAVAIVDRAMSS